MSRQARNRGFTLIETMIVVAVIGIMATLVAAVFARRGGDNRAKAAVRSVADLMLFARTEAIRTGVNHIVYVQLDPADDPLEDAGGIEVAALMIADADGDGLPDAGEQKGSVPFDDTGSLQWGSTFAAVTSTAAPNDNAAGTFPAVDPDFACCTFTDQGGSESRWVVFLPDGMPRGFTTGPFAAGAVGSGRGAVYVSSGTRDYAVVLAPLGGVRVHSWNRGADAWTN
ncbi:MAG TPA: prepilin-type N-terminal cleavage/methylation domain-containing protein [Myxococcota bacterium]|jgi:prepilin-type N-terminal cleavage/methylation domain-containing protein